MPSTPRDRLRPGHARSRPARLWYGLGAVAGALLLGSCAGNHHVLDPHGDGASRISAIGWFMIITSAVIALVFLGMLAWALLRGGIRPAWRTEHGLVVAGGVVLPVLVITALTVLTLNALNDRGGQGAEHIEVTGHQFWWEVRYPDRGIVTANELHIPVDRPVEITLRSADVIHSFWVPGLNGKIDMVPGQPNHITLQAHDPGTYRGQCAEYCGIQHAWMLFTVQADSPDDFEAWTRQQAADARAPSSPSEVAGQRAFETLPCASCHTIRGTGADGDVGPDLTHLASRPQLGAGVIPNDRGHLGGWIANPQALKPGNLMPAVPMDPGQLQSLLDYLGSLH